MLRALFEFLFMIVLFLSAYLTSWWLLLFLEPVLPFHCSDRMPFPVGGFLITCLLVGIYRIWIADLPFLLFLLLAAFVMGCLNIIFSGEFRWFIIGVILLINKFFV